MAKSILVVDYDPKRIETTTKPFTEAGFRVEVARDGIAGVEAFARLHPDLVLVEMMLPKRHGFEVCQELRKLRPSKRTPVLILGTSQAERYRMQAIGAGASDYLVRPIADDRLIEICRGLLSEPNQDLPEVKAPVAVPEPPRAFRPVAPAPSVPPVDLASLTDDEIAARLDAILPSGPAPSLEKPKTPAPEPRQAAPVARPPKPRSVEPPTPREAPRPASIAAATERPVARPKLPQEIRLPELPTVGAETRRRGLAWPIVAVVALLAVVGGSYAWRAVKSDGVSAVEPAALDPTDFAKFQAAGDPVPAEDPGAVAFPTETPIETEPAAVPVPRTEAAPPTAPPSNQSTLAEPQRPAPSPTPPSPQAEARQAAKPQSPPPPAPRPSAPAPEPTDDAVVGLERIAAPVEPPVPPAPAAAITPIEGVTRVPGAEASVEEPEVGVVPGSIVELAEADSPPVALARPAPAYPSLARRMRREGKVAVRLLVDEQGNVADAVVPDATTPADFSAAAIKAVQTWRYRPARKDGVPVKVWVTEVIGFKL